MNARGERPRDVLRRAAGRAVRRAWAVAADAGTIRSGDSGARRFRSFGTDACVVFPWTALYGERWMRIGDDTIVGPNCALSVGMSPGQEMLSEVVLDIGSRCLIGRGSSIVAHFEVVIEDDVVTGPGVYITDQNHDYSDPERPIGEGSTPERPVRVGRGSWLGAGVVVLPGVTIGPHVTVAANAVVTRDLPGHVVAAGVPARIVRRYDGDGWAGVDRAEEDGRGAG
ncbi:MAG: acyltransferase [Actinomycetota bacterium]